MHKLSVQFFKIRNVLLILGIVAIHTNANAQKVNIAPTIQPTIFTYETEITVTYDVTGTSLAGINAAWLWTWLPSDDTGGKYSINPASDNAPVTDNAKCTKNTDGSKTTFSITFIPKDFFDKDISAEKELGMLLKGNDWSNGQTVDHVATITEKGAFQVAVIQPEHFPAFVTSGDMLSILAISSVSAQFSFSVDNVTVDEQSSILQYNFDYNVTEASGDIVPCKITVSDPTSNEDTTISFEYIVRTPTPEISRPIGIVPGINYHEDQTTATLCLLAPLKSSVYVLGDFNDFQISPDYLMNKDGEYFWIAIDGLSPNTEYAFQYLVDESVYVADPYADKILDPDDKDIPTIIYPNIKAFPEHARHDQWYFNRLSIIETGQTAYSWKNDQYAKPDNEDLIIYELLIRDFFDPNNRSYQSLMDTLSYLKNLGVNAIELMPIQEFNGNSSWGYNPTFMFAPDKAYGTKSKLKDFIDFAHQEGMAVILDVVFNHQDIPNPYVSMYYDFVGTQKPTAENPWFNEEPTHPYSVFSDMNHESTYTQNYMDTTLYYWINEYHVDGFRFDLSKGFTQFNSGNDEGRWGLMDQSRIDIITRMADKVWSYAPDTWLILEHFANNTEEKILADYGLMLWGNMHGAYKETILGYHDNNKSNLDWAYAPSRGWNNLNLITYMESHDEERQMYEASQYGNSEGSYNIKDKETALNRIKAAYAFLYTIPGPKMFWQFGELGYDISIEENGRTGEKPVKWDYYTNADRKKLHDLKSELLKFRTEQPVISNGDFSWQVNGEVKRIEINHPEMQTLIIGNFGVKARKVKAEFSATGIWYDFFTGDSFDVTDTEMEMLFAAGEFHMYSTKKIEGVATNLVPWNANFLITAINDKDLVQPILYPNPSSDLVKILGIPNGAYRLTIISADGRSISRRAEVREGEIDGSFQELPVGLYFLTLRNTTNTYSFKLIKE